jgi:hypothetical protein
MLIMTSVQAGMIRVEAIGAPPLPYSGSAIDLSATDAWGRAAAGD